MDQSYDEMRFLVLKFFQLTSPRARRLVEAFPVLRAFVWTEYLRVYDPEIPVQRAEFMELLAYDHDSFYREGAMHDRDPPRALSPDHPRPTLSPKRQTSTSSPTSSSSDTDSSTDDEALPVSQSRVPATARIPKKPKPLAAPFGRSVPRDPPADPVSVLRDPPGDSRTAPPPAGRSVLQDPPGGPGIAQVPYKGPINPPYSRYYMDPALAPSMHGTSALRGPPFHPAPVRIDPPLPTATNTQTRTDSGSGVPPAEGPSAAQHQATATDSASITAAAALAREAAATRAAATAVARAKDREALLLAEVNRLRKELHLNHDPETFRTPPSSSSSRPSSSSSSSSSSGAGYPLRRGRATAPTLPHTHAPTQYRAEG